MVKAWRLVIIFDDFNDIKHRNEDQISLQISQNDKVRTEKRIKPFKFKFLIIEYLLASQTHMVLLNLYWQHYGNITIQKFCLVTSDVTSDVWSVTSYVTDRSPVGVYVHARLSCLWRHHGEIIKHKVDHKQKSGNVTGRVIRKQNPRPFGGVTERDLRKQNP